jgi:hypothetical protein
MKERDNRDIQFTHLAMENVRLQNYARELEEELRLRDEEDGKQSFRSCHGFLKLP